MRLNLLLTQLNMRYLKMKEPDKTHGDVAFTLFLLGATLTGIGLGIKYFVIPVVKQISEEKSKLNEG